MNKILKKCNFELILKEIKGFKGNLKEIVKKCPYLGYKSNEYNNCIYACM